MLPLLAALLAAGWLWYDNSEDGDVARPVATQTPAAPVQAEEPDIDLPTQPVAMETPTAHVQAEEPEIDLAQPVAIQAALPLLLTDDTMVVYVVDDSGSMMNKLPALHQALREVAEKPTENSEIAMLMFGTSHRMLFDFAEPDQAPWDDTVAAFTADSGGTAMFAALREALAMVADQEACQAGANCRQKRIVLMSDGEANDVIMSSSMSFSDWRGLTNMQKMELMKRQAELEREVIAELAEAGIPVDTIALGSDADEAGLRRISDATGGTFIKAYH